MTARNVATFILEQLGEMSAMKLQKLVYYSQSWSLVWNETPLFDEPFQAWANGPVCPDLYSFHRGQFKVSPGSLGGDSSALNDEQKETISVVLNFYGKKSAQWLSDLTHLEAPWREARVRAGVIEGESCKEEITHADMHEYYSGLQASAS